MDLMTAGSLMSGAGQLLGGLGGLKSSDGVSGKAMGAQRYQAAWLDSMYKQNELSHAKQMLPIQYEMWDRYQLPHQKSQIQYRVQDARKAGLHPLFALGQSAFNSPSFAAGTGGSSSPPGIPGQSRTGSGIGDALSALGGAALSYGNYKQQKQAAEQARIRADEQHFMDMAEQRSRIQLNEVNADIAARQYWDSQLRRAAVVANSTQDTGSTVARIRTPYGTVNTNPNIDDAELAQTRWGEPGEWITGAANMAADLSYNSGLHDWLVDRMMDLHRHLTPRQTDRPRSGKWYSDYTGRFIRRD